MTKNTLKTPDTEKSTNTNRLKRVSDESVITITNLEDDIDANGDVNPEKKKLPLKQVKREKVLCLDFFCIKSEFLIIIC